MSGSGESKTIRGSCLCGGVRFELAAAPLWMSRCHCSRCRKSGASPTVAVRARDFRFVQGAELVTRYVPPPPYTIVRCFCRICGTPLGEPETNPRGFPIAAGALDDDPGVRLALHEHVAETAPWEEIADDLPKFPGHPPGLGGGPAS
jgi:hypothetical protein